MTRLENSLIKDLFNQGFQRNIMVYDHDALPGICTIRLFHLLKEVAKDNNSNFTGDPVSISHVYLSIDACNRLLEQGYNDDITLVVINNMDTIQDAALTKYKATRVKDDKYMLLMIDNNGKVMIGSY